MPSTFVCYQHPLYYQLISPAACYQPVTYPCYHHLLYQYRHPNLINIHNADKTYKKKNKLEI